MNVHHRPLVLSFSTIAFFLLPRYLLLFAATSSPCAYSSLSAHIVTQFCFYAACQGTKSTFPTLPALQMTQSRPVPVLRGLEEDDKLRVISPKPPSSTEVSPISGLLLVLCPILGLRPAVLLCNLCRFI
ncbi:hypothetical protein JOM56_000858 [Amanita muscaria]